MPRIFFDNNSTTFMRAEVAESMSDLLSNEIANPASQHDFGRNARQELESYRDRLSSILKLSANDQFLFTSGGTESNNLAILGHFPVNQDLQNSNVVSSAIEHPSVLATLEWLKSQNVEIRLVKAGSKGVVDADDFTAAIDANTRLVCCMLANNETGVLQPVSEIASVCSNRNVPFHVDAVQAIGKLDFDFSEIGCSSATVSAHKFHGPPGVGGLILESAVQLSPMMFGGFQQGGTRPGTESLVLAAGFCKAAELAILEEKENIKRVKAIQSKFEAKILELAPRATINGFLADRLPNTSNISFPGIDRQQFMMAADVAGLACSTGSACSSGSSQPSHVLMSMKCKKEVIDSAIRFGFSSLNTLSEVDQAVEIISRIFLAQTKQNKGE